MLGDVGTAVVAALVAGVGVTAVFSLAILGAARSMERRDRSAAWAALAVVAGLGVLAACAVGIYAVAVL